MDSFESGDPYIEWNEENAAQEPPEQVEEPITIILSGGTLGRLKRIQELKNYNVEAALNFAIALGWLRAELQAKAEKTQYLIAKNKPPSSEQKHQYHQTKGNFFKDQYGG